MPLVRVVFHRKRVSVWPSRSSRKMKIYQCSICGRKFSSFNYIRSHHTSSHRLSKENSLNLLGISIKKCKMCSNFTSFDCATNQYKTYCSVKCANGDIDKKNKTIQTVLNRYGTTNVLNIKDKIVGCPADSFIGSGSKPSSSNALVNSSLKFIKSLLFHEHNGNIGILSHTLVYLEMLSHFGSFFSSNSTAAL